MEEEDGKKNKKQVEKHFFLKVVGDGLGTLVGYEMTPKNNFALVMTNIFFFKIKRYGYGSIRINLIELLRAFSN